MESWVNTLMVLIVRLNNSIVGKKEDEFGSCRFYDNGYECYLSDL